MVGRSEKVQRESLHLEFDIFSGGQRETHKLEFSRSLKIFIEIIRFIFTSQYLGCNNMQIFIKCWYFGH